jgi:hypothetical protein
MLSRAAKHVKYVSGFTTGSAASNNSLWPIVLLFYESRSVSAAFKLGQVRT